MYRSRDIYVYVMYYVYVTPWPSLLIESTDSMIETGTHVHLHVLCSEISLETYVSGKKIHKCVHFAAKPTDYCNIACVHAPSV